MRRTPARCYPAVSVSGAHPHPTATTWWQRTGHHLPPVVLVVVGSLVGLAAAPYVGLMILVLVVNAAVVALALAVTGEGS